jgi:predicted metal-dependent hydrolase
LRAGNEARLVIPRGGSQAEAFRFLERSEGWLLEQKNKWQNHTDRPWREGTTVLFRGEETILRVENRDDRLHLCFSDQKILLTNLLPDYRPLVRKHLRQLAAREFHDRTWELARIHGITIHRVTVRAQTTRWGSCSPRGTISLNWRLIQAPPQVSDYLIIHELMHRREMNHSARFWKLVANACPDYRLAEQWLKKIRLEHD